MIENNITNHKSVAHFILTMSAATILARFQTLVNRGDSPDIFGDGLFNLPCFCYLDYEQLSEEKQKIHWAKYTQYFYEYILANLNRNNGVFVHDDKLLEYYTFHSLQIIDAAEDLNISQKFVDFITNQVKILHPIHGNVYKDFQLWEVFELLNGLSNEQKARFILLLCNIAFEATPTSEYEIVAGSMDLLDAELNITIRAILEIYDPFQLQNCLRVLEAVENKKDAYSASSAIKRGRDEEDQDLGRDDVDEEVDVSDEDNMEM